MFNARIFMTLFSLPFLGVGLWMAWSVSTTLLEWNAMKSWDSVRAQVVRGGYETHSDDDGSTYKAFAEYTYSRGGQEYTGHRVGIESGADNVGDWQQETGRRLQNAQGQSIDVYVDPAVPHSSVIDREIRWGMIGFKMIFVIAFGGAGGVLFFASFMPSGTYTEAERPEIRDKPWLVQKDWAADGPIGSSSKAAMRFAWFFTIMWNAISAPIPFMLKKELLEKENYPALIALIFPIVGIGLLVWAVRRTLEWMRFGSAPVTLDPFPGSIGGNVGGTIELPYLFDSTAQFLVTLGCYKNEYRRRNNDSGREETAVWQDTVVAHTESGLNGTRIVFRFDVPEGLNPTDADKPARDYYLWKLNVSAELPGPDMDRDYEIPVYATKQKSAYIAARAVEASERATLEREERLAHEKIRLLQGPYGDQLFYPMGRNVGSAIVGMIVGLCFAAPGSFMIWHVGLWFFGGLFFAIGALIFVSCVYMPLNSLTVGKDLNGGIVTVRRILGIPVKRGYAIPEDVASIVAESHFATNTGSKQVKHYTVYAMLPRKQRLILGEGFHGTGEADAAIKFIREKLEIRKNSTLK